MKAIIPCIALAATQLFLVDMAYAQTTAPSHLQAPPQNIVIDGSSKDWGDSLRYYNAEKQISYSLANDANNLYMAVRIDDRIEQQKVLHSGLTLSVNTKGKKKETFSITFPLNLQGGNIMPDMKNDNNNDDVEQEQEALKQAVLTNLRGIKVEGFTDIEGNMITTSNTYGIQTAISYDDKGFLVCEASIPLKFFHAEIFPKNEWAFNFKINGATKPTNPEGGESGPGGGGGHGGRGGGGGFGGGGGGGGRGGHGGGGRGGNGGQGGGQAGQGEFFKSEDFWTHFYLAK